MSLQNYLLAYWPTADAVNQCIRNEAETLHEAVLLAIHQPYPLRYRYLANNVQEQTNEEALFQHLMMKHPPSGAHVVPITGQSGAGKSHMVRILAARLQRENRDGRYVIIRIPKSASLRRVVELILAQLPGKAYDEVRQGFARVMDEFNPNEAVINFQAALENELNALAENLRGSLQVQPANSTLREQLGHALTLPGFLGDTVSGEHFRQNVYPRILRRAIGGQTPGEDQGSVEDFRADDFALPDNIAMDQASQQARTYYTRNLQGKEDQKNAVARLLNEKVVDGAVRRLFGLHQAVGGKTLQDLILEIRQQLHADGKELVILVEDLVALTGIQDTLLKVLIGEAVRDGEQTLATIRSVIAVTDGYITGRDTIATRAVGEYIVESELNNDGQVLTRTRALVASYLNAARWGYPSIVARDWGMTDKPPAWRATDPSEYPEHESVLTAFGSSDAADHIPLFPYTPAAIEQLARASLRRKDGQLVFSPRSIINRVLREVLLQGRGQFEQGRFPNLPNPEPNAEIAGWLARLPAETRNRYRSIVQLWGNNPQNVGQIGSIPSAVFTAFNLPRPNDLPELANNIPLLQDIPTGSVMAQAAPQSAAPPIPDYPDGNEGLKTALENWVRLNERLPQQTANQIRKAIASALNQSLDWEAERCKSFDIVPNHISLPHAKGEGTIQANPIKVADDNQETDGQLRKELAAVTRFHALARRQLNYAEADDDLILIASLVERLIPEAKKFIRTEVRRRLGMAVRLLAVNSRILGLKPNGNTPQALASFLFSEVKGLQPLDNAPDKFVAWRTLQMNAQSVRADLVRLVARYSGSFQGVGDLPYAMDMPRIVACYSQNETVNLDDRDLTPELKTQLREMSETSVLAKARHACREAQAIRNTLIQEFGDDFDKAEIERELEELTRKLCDAGGWSQNVIGMDSGAFSTLRAAFRNCALKAALEKIPAENPDELEQDRLISFAGNLDMPPLVIAERFANTARKVVQAANQLANKIEDQNSGVAPEQVADHIQSLFASLLNTLNTLDHAEVTHATVD